MLTNYLIYLRKSRADNPDMTVDEVLAKHETILQDFARSELRVDPFRRRMARCAAQAFEDRVALMAVLADSGHRQNSLLN